MVRDLKKRPWQNLWNAEDLNGPLLQSQIGDPMAIIRVHQNSKKKTGSCLRQRSGSILFPEELEFVSHRKLKS